MMFVFQNNRTFTFDQKEESLRIPHSPEICVDVQLAPVLWANCTARHWHHEVGLFTLRLLFLLSSCCDLLNNLPVSCLDVLVDLPVQGGSENYNGKNLDAVQVLLDFMEKRIDRSSNYKEGLIPVLLGSLLKYTGYGNAAGLLMARGLLVGGKGETQYSEGEDSETEEYKSATNFDIMSGCEEEPRPNPSEDMTEEQKEYEAEKLFKSSLS
ncbi:hypothetical protein WMY93_033185 [Mugilogobius chulae]|uniref:Synembryn n=1 Tax=Mugilogobius chulae TaxID=88201 RepID=A0AAW0MHM3_9GOBI